MYTQSRCPKFGRKKLEFLWEILPLVAYYSYRWTKFFLHGPWGNAPAHHLDLWSREWAANLEVWGTSNFLRSCYDCNVCW